VCLAAKNVILAGVKALTIHDSRATSLEDLAAQFYLTEEDVGTNRAEACKDKLQELNGAVAVSASTAELTEEFLKAFQVCVWCGARYHISLLAPLAGATRAYIIIHRTLWPLHAKSMLHADCTARSNPPAAAAL
jgi:ubiquitin-activating enzyme E1